MEATSSAAAAMTFARRFRQALRHLRRRSAIHATARVVPWLELAWLATFLLSRAGWPLVSGPEVAAVLIALLAAASTPGVFTATAVILSMMMLVILPTTLFFIVVLENG